MRLRHGATLAAGGLLALFWWMAASVSREHSTTADEIFHVTAGYAYWTTGDFRLQPENGNLPQRLATLPLLAQDLRFPKLDQSAWLTADVAELGHQFFYESGNDLARMLAASRTAVALLGVALGALVFAWSRSLFGPRGALVSAALAAFCPNLLAHAGLATSDIAASLGFLAAVLTGWRLLHRVTPGRVLLAGLAWGGLALSKFSAPLFAPMALLMLATRLVRGAALPVRLGPWRARLRGGRAAGAMLGAGAAALLVALAVVWAAYDFRFAGLRGAGNFNHDWSDYHDGLALRAIGWARDLRLLPEAWLHGLAHTLHFAGGRPAFFMGEYGTHGWAMFFPVAFLLKTTLPALAVLGLACAGAATARRSRLGYRLAPLGALGAVYVVFALTSHLNIGHRHILPLYPALYIFAGAAALMFRRTWLAALVVALLAWHAGESLAIRPHYLAFFNPLLGGPARAHEQFVDSSLDWGQDLRGLKLWLDAHAEGEKIFLSYFGSGSPAHEGIRATRIADGYFDLRARALAPELTGGIYALSATMFRQVYTQVRHGWTTAQETEFQNLTCWLADWHAGQEATPRDEAIRRMLALEHLRFGRLCAGLRGRAPDDNIGFSILIFRLTDADVHRLLAGPPPFLS